MLPTTHRTYYNHDSSSQVHRENTFEIEESKTKTKPWYRKYMTLEVFYFISLVMILYRLQTLSDQNYRVLEIVNSMQSQLGNLERKIELLVSQKPTQDISQFDNTKPLEQSIADVLKSMKFPTQDSTEKTEPIIPQVKQSTSETAESILKVPTPEEPLRFNAADLLRGASVDIAKSSSSSWNSIIGYDKTNFVLLSRRQSPSDKAWCTDAKNPVLTINLAKYIKPISVSYQHSKWNGTIPNGAPKTYDVVACLDFYCEKWTLLVSNCEYSQHESNEQMCNISSHPDVPSIGKVQFRFRENYGNTKTTCVHLVRVYGEIPARIDEKQLKSEEICADLRWYYHNRNFKKSTLTDKNCTLLYEHNCCSECPECCQECLISDDYRPTVTDYVHLIILLVLALLIWLTFFAVIIIALVKIIKFLAKFLTNFFSKMRGLNQVKK
ncbi:unnamed protein product [Caenorhabditis nigoni]